MREGTKPQHFMKAAIAAIVLIILFISGIELYWRSNGYQLSYNDDKMFWADMRRQAYEPADRSTVFIGSSRIKWDIDIDTWERLTGEKAIQLAIVGSTPRKILLDLADDEKFAGKLVMDVAEPLVFALDTMRTERLVREALGYYYEETPAQRISATLGRWLESKFIFLEEGKFGLSQLLMEHNQEYNRAGINVPGVPFRKDYTYTTSRRQNKFTPVLLNSPQLQEAHVKRWVSRMWATRKDFVPARGKSLDSLCFVYKTAFDKIRARGGTVFLVRLPSNGPHLEAEKKFFPREKYWEKMLQNTSTPGFHFADNPLTSGMICTEASHLNPGDAITFTNVLVNALRTEFGWKFPSDKYTK
jgi:hypothetical protein